MAREVFTQEPANLTFEVFNYWRRHDRDLVDIAKKERKELLEKRRSEEVMRERERQIRKINFLLRQSELVSDFMKKKMGAVAMILGQDTPQPAPILIAANSDREMDQDATSAAQNSIDVRQKHVRSFDEDLRRRRGDRVPKSASRKFLFSLLSHSSRCNGESIKHARADGDTTTYRHGRKSEALSIERTELACQLV